MNIIDRYLTDEIISDLNEKMVFIGGPRQVGKTTLGKDIIGRKFEKYDYFNWDNRFDRKRLLNSKYSGNAKVLIFDEIHKFPEWKNFIKGEYDNLKDRYKFLITGSARLDIYRKGSDSLSGRYFYYRLHPFSLAEKIGIKNKIPIFEDLIINSNNFYSDFEILLKFGGFPEVLFKQSEKFLRRWHNNKIERLFREDIRDVMQVREIAKMQILSDILSDKVGSLFSINSLIEDIGVSFKAINRWIEILESFYYCFRIYPYHKNILYSLKKMPKLYLWDWSEAEEDSKRFENMIASHL